PATGHAVTLLAIPQAILAAVPDGPLTRDAVKVRALVEDQARTAAVVVTLAEEMPVTESIELTPRLRREANLAVAGLGVNPVYPAHCPSGSLAARILDRLHPGTDLVEPVRVRARTNQSGRALNERYLARLRETLPLPTTIVPKIFVPQLGPKELGEIARLVGVE